MMPIMPVVARARRQRGDRPGRGGRRRPAAHGRHALEEHRQPVADGQADQLQHFREERPRATPAWAKGAKGSTSFTIASPTGEGMTDARTFSRLRRCVLVDHFRIV